MKKFIISALPFLLLIPLLSFNSAKDPAHSWLEWIKLGQRKVNFSADKDEIGVGVHEGYFNGLQVKVRRGSINMIKMVIHFGNGDVQEIPLKNNFTDGSVSRIIELPGNVRMINKVVFWYETAGFTNSKAIVELWGRH